MSRDTSNDVSWRNVIFKEIKGNYLKVNAYVKVCNNSRKTRADSRKVQ